MVHGCSSGARADGAEASEERRTSSSGRMTLRRSGSESVVWRHDLDGGDSGVAASGDKFE
jgi:hypothetical protein